MDIAKYIGLFLLKTNYCYIHGLGNLELKKKPASHDGEALKSPAYEVIVTPGGSIDDSLANFIATNEQISISKASNSLREFSTQARTDLHAGKDVVIPSLGKFVEQNGIIQFITDPHMQYTPRAIPTVKHVAQAHAQTAAQIKTPAYSNPNIPAKQTNWGKIALFVAIPVVLIIIVVVAMKFMGSQPAAEPETPAVVEQPLEQAPPPPVAVDTTKTDSTLAAAQATGNIQASNGILNFKVILQTYKSSAPAEKRAAKLKSFGNAVEVFMKDSSNYYVVLPISAAPADTTHVLDSLRRTFNPKGVSILQ